LSAAVSPALAATCVIVVPLPPLCAAATLLSGPAGVVSRGAPHQTLCGGQPS
jgi:hypothetical protein